MPAYLLTPYRPFSLQKNLQSNFKKDFLSDPSTYPLIVIMGTACFFVVGMSANALLNYKNIRISPSKKNEIIPTGGEERYNPVTQALASKPRGFHAKSLKDIRYEGMGVDHDEWVKEHKDYTDYTKQK